MNIKKEDRRRLGIVTAMHMFDWQGGLYIHSAFGRVIDRLAMRYEKVYLCAPIKQGQPNQSRDYRLQAQNIEIIAQPFHQTTIGSLRHGWGISKAYFRTFRKSDVIFIREMIPFVSVVYLCALLFRKIPCHWIAGNSVGLLKSHRRSGWIMDALSMMYAWQDRFFTKLGRAVTKGAFICNGQELGEIYRSPRTTITVSSAITREEFFEREDTCLGGTIKLLFIGFVRPEKGLEFLLEAAAKLKLEKPWELTIVGAWNFFEKYRQKLDRIIAENGIADKVRWVGHIPYGPDMFAYMREADILILPTLSEGTPRVLVEARANSLPLIATNVGGIPTSVTGGKDGLLVPPKNPEAIAEAIQRIVGDEDLRRSLIRNGLEFARRTTVDHFVELVVQKMEEDRN